MTNEPLHLTEIPTMGHKTTAQALREQLMAPRAIERVHAMHALELELEDAPACAVAEELEAFTARGIPYYAPEDPQYREWVAKAVGYWEKLHADPQVTVPSMTASKVRGGHKGKVRLD
jgi:hypothetical protein